MAWSFGDSFDLYAATADMINGYWDSSAGTPTFAAGRFAGSQALQIASTNQSLTKSSGVNDAVHHCVVAFRQTAAISGSTLGAALQLFDGATAQCSIVFRSDGAILLTSGVPTGTILATYTGAFPAANTWYAFEFEVVINNTTGSFAARKNGNSVNDFSATALNTRVSANNYANKLQFGSIATTGLSAQQFDDLFWRSDAASVAWLGDIRCYARMPVSDASVTFSRSTGASNFSCVDEAQQNALTDYVFDSNPGDADFYGVASIASTPATVIATTVRGYMQKSDAGTRTAAVQIKSPNGGGAPTTWNPSDKTASVTLTGSNLIATCGGSNQGVRAAIYQTTGKFYFEVTMGWLVSNDYIGIATSVAALNSSSSLNTCVLSNSGVIVLNNVLTSVNFGPLAAGNVIGIAVDLVNRLIWFRVAPSGNWNANAAYAPGGSGGVDFSAIGSISVAPYAFFVSFTYAYTANFGATAFSGAVPSGFTAGWLGAVGTIVASPTLVLTTSGWQWAWRTDLTDPATGAAWTAAAVNNAQIGPRVIA